MFLNVCNATKGEGLMDFLRERTKEIDVFCFQEAVDNFMLKSAGMFSNFEMAELSKHADGIWDFALKTLVREGIIAEQKNVLAEEQDTGLVMMGTINIRDEKMVIANVHGKPYHPDDKKDTEGRLRQSKEIIESIEMCRGEKMVIGGDFNLDIDTESIRMFEKAGYRNLIKEFGIKTTRNRLAWIYPEKHLFADYVFVSPEVKVKSFEVIDILVSDHLPMVLETE